MKQIFFTGILIFAFCFTSFTQDRNFSPLDIFGKVSVNAEKARLDNLFITLSRDKTYEGIIVLEFDKNISTDKKIARIKRIIKWSKFRKFELNRITFMFSQEDSEQTVFLSLPSSSKLLENLAKNYKSVKAEEFTQKIKELFPEK